MLLLYAALFFVNNKTIQTFLLPAPVFRSCCIFMRYLQNIFIFYAFTQYIFGAHASRPGHVRTTAHGKNSHRKNKSPGPFCEPSGPERVPGFVFALCAGKWPARRAPCAAQQFLLGLGQLLEGILPPQGGAFIRAQFQIGKTPAPLARVYFAPRPLWWARRRAEGSVVQPVYSVPPVHRTIYTKAGFAERTAQMRPLFFNT